MRELATMSYADVCAGLNRDGIPTPSGAGLWSSGKLASLVNNATYAGLSWFAQVPADAEPLAGRPATLCQDAARRRRREDHDVRDPDLVRSSRAGGSAGGHGRAAAHAGRAAARRRRPVHAAGRAGLCALFGLRSPARRTTAIDGTPACERIRRRGRLPSAVRGRYRRLTRPLLSGWPGSGYGRRSATLSGSNGR